MRSHITTIHATLTEIDDEAAPTPTFMLFSAEPEADFRLLTDFVPVAAGERSDLGVRITWTLPDPAITLGHANVVLGDAKEYQTRNRSCREVQLLIVRDSPGATDRQSLYLSPYYVDWLGALGDDPPGDDADRLAPVSGLALRRARLRWQSGQVAQAVRALLDEVALATNAKGEFMPRAAYALHEAAMLAEAGGKLEAWEYFETVALTTYPNCHDALIGLALRAQGQPAQALPLFARAYAIRPDEDDLRLYARAIARAGKPSPAAARQTILARAATVDLSTPLFRDKGGHPLTISPDEILAHLRALAG